MSLIFFGFTLICVFTPSYQIDSWAILESQCKAVAENIDNCWTEHANLPECKNDGETVVCGEDEIQRMRLCKREIQHKAKNTVNNYKAINDGLCDNKDLHQQFSKRKPCWTTARNCAMAFLNETTNTNNLNSEDCKKALEKAEDCASYDPWCKELQTNLTLATYENSQCMEVFPEGQKLVSLAPILMTTRNFDTMLFVISCVYLVM